MEIKISNTSERLKSNARNKEEEEPKGQTDYVPQEEDKKKRADWVMERYQKMLEAFQAGYRWFGIGEDGKNLNLTQYINENENRLNGYAEKPDWKEDWQANVFDNVTHDKFVSYLAKLAAQRMKTYFFNNEDLSVELARVLSNIYDKVGRGKNGQGKDTVMLFQSMFEAASKGTIIREHMYRDGKRKVKTSRNKASGVYDYKTEYEWEDVWDEIVPLNEFLPGDVSKTNLQYMADCARVMYPDYDTFRQQFADYPDIGKVNPLKEQPPEFRTQYSIPIDVQENQVLVIKYYNRVTDSYDIIANGILLTEVDNPLPYKHKMLPFTVGRFQLFSNTFFWGMALPHKLAQFQDVTNSLWNMMLDQMFIVLKRPIFNASGEDFEINWLYAFPTINFPKGTDLSSIREFNLQSDSGMAQNALKIIKTRMDESAASGSEQSGVAGAGRAKTAEEVATARQAMLEISGLFLQFMEWAEEERAEHRIKIMMEMYPKKLKSTGKYRKWVIDDVRLLSDELGKMYVNITDKPRPPIELNKENMKTGEMSQVIDIPVEAFNDLTLLVKVVPGSSIKDSEQEKLKKELAYYQIAQPNPLSNQEELFTELTEAFGKNPGKMMAKKEEGLPQMPAGMPTAPTMGGQAPGIRGLSQPVNI